MVGISNQISLSTTGSCVFVNWKILKKLTNSIAVTLVLDTISGKTKNRNGSILFELIYIKR